MPPGMIQELQIFLMSAFWGMLVVFYYDFFRILRGIKKHSTWMVAVEDLVFWLGTACMIIAVLYSYNRGQVRLFLLAGMGCGSLLYNWGISPFICGFVLFISKKLKTLLKNVIKHSKMKNSNYAKEGKDE